MRRLHALLGDRKRAQRGSVLSGVLIIVAFLSIIAGALTTELSTNFLISRALVNRVGNQATVNSAMELAIDQLQHATPLDSACPAMSPLSLNGSREAVTSYARCAPVVDSQSPQFVSVGPSSHHFNRDGTQASLTNEYIVGDTAGNVFDYPFGQTTPRWTLALGSTGPAALVADPYNSGDYLDLIPASGSTCTSSANCVSVRSDDGVTNNPSVQCTFAAANSPVTAQPAMSTGSTGTVFFGDTSHNGTVFAYTLNGDDASDCGTTPSTKTAGAPIVGGPVVFPCSKACGGNTDEIYVLTTADSGSSQLVRFAYDNPALTQVGLALNLPWPSASGLAMEPTASLPAKVAISFQGGQVAVVQINVDGTMSISATKQLGGGTQINDAPYWCHQCPVIGGNLQQAGTADLIGVGASDGGLYLFDTSLNAFASYPSGGSPITTTPGADSAGDWYFGANDGNMYEVQLQQPVMTLIKQYGAIGKVGSSAQVGDCPAGICVYFGSDNGAYLVPLDVRAAQMSACLTTSPSPYPCSSDNPRLWTSTEVGVAGSPHQAVHVQGWSYYSP